MSDVDIILKLILACAFGGIIGYIREREKKAAGLRTHMLVCMGSALFMLISIYMGMHFKFADSSRIAAGVVTGIGFIGAGAIIQAGGAVRGITTAASIWSVAAIGLGIGCGFYLGSTVATIIALVVLQIMHEIELRYISPEKRED